MTNFDLWQIRLTAAFVALGSGLLLLFGQQLPPQVPLLYSRAWGTDQLVTPLWLWLAPGLCLIIGSLAYWLTKRFVADKVLSLTSILSTIAAQSIITLALVRIIVLVI